MLGKLLSKAQNSVDELWLRKQPVVSACFPGGRTHLVPNAARGDELSRNNHPQQQLLLHNVAVPLLIANATDDPIANVEGLPKDAPEKNEKLLVAITKEGGHVAWCQGWWPVRMPYRVGALLCASFLLLFVSSLFSS